MEKTIFVLSIVRPDKAVGVLFVETKSFSERWAVEDAILGEISKDLCLANFFGWETPEERALCADIFSQGCYVDVKKGLSLKLDEYAA